MTDCYRCGEEGHARRDCPRDAELPAAPAGRRAENEIPAISLRRPPEEISADPHARAAEARALLSAALTGNPRPIEPAGAYVTTPFRESMGLPPRTEAELREIARQQLTRT